jgi:hypothetical protein
VKRFKSHHWFGYFFDKSMVLFDNSKKKQARLVAAEKSA